jgi:hypothetical protein
MALNPPAPVEALAAVQTVAPRRHAPCAIRYLACAIRYPRAAVFCSLFQRSTTETPLTA